MISFRTLLCLSLLSMTVAAAADPAQPGGFPAIGLPLRCTPGTDCWVANYVDMDASPGARDYLCGSRSYDGHDGVDFAIRDLGIMQSGVPVVAAARGKVRSIRDGMDDTGLLAPGAEQALRGRECGNGVVIVHGNRWQTQYCHLRRGSILVKPGDRVEQGTVLGQVGMSGWAEFPHVHLAVRHAGVELDPFSGGAAGAGCDASPRPLWQADTAPSYEPAAIYNAGFAAEAPVIQAIRDGRPPAPPGEPRAGAIVLWADMLGVAAGDRIRFTITDPRGKVLVDEEQVLERTQARRYMYAGKKRTSAAWLPGRYAGRVELSRPADHEGSPWRTSVEREFTIR